MKKIVECWGLGVVVSHPSGVHYHQQAAGVLCMQKELEGVFVPLDGGDVWSGLEHLPFRQGTLGIDDVLADAIDRLLASESETSFMRVDRDRLADSCESWVFVAIGNVASDLENVPVGPRAPVYGFADPTGVLVWPNSD